MSKTSDYAAKLAKLEPTTLLPMLAPNTQSYLRERAKSYRFTYQELRQVSQAARDLQMWCEDPIETWWEKQETRLEAMGRERKKQILRDLDVHLRQLAAAEKIYPARGLVAPPRRKVRLERSRPRTRFSVFAQPILNIRSAVACTPSTQYGDARFLAHTARFRPFMTSRRSSNLTCSKSSRRSSSTRIVAITSVPGSPRIPWSGAIGKAF